jgi:hypothetical protein
MKQEVQLEEKLIREGCFDCKKPYKHLEVCRDGKLRCKRCKKKMVTNKWYDPNWRTKNQFVGKFNMSGQEKSILIEQKIKKGATLSQTKRQVNIDVLHLKKLRCRKYYEDRENIERQKLEKENKIEESKRFLAGLGQKKR